MKFWDSSALLPLVVGESATEKVMELVQDDSDIIAWWGTETECVSAIARLEREDLLHADEVLSALQRLDVLRSSWNEVQPVEMVRITARRLLRVHPLRAADSLQLAAAVCAAESKPSSLNVVCLDARLTTAAQKEGFTVLPRG